MSETPKLRNDQLNGLVVCAIGLFLFILILCVVEIHKQPQPPATPYVPPPVTMLPHEQEKSAPPSVEAKWRRVAGWGGSDNKNTDNFTIQADKWRVEWKTESHGEEGNFSIAVHEADGTYKDLVVNRIGSGHETTIERGAGSYYLVISSSQVYGIVVSEYR